LIGHARFEACTGLDDNVMAFGFEFFNGLWGRGHATLPRQGFKGHAEIHGIGSKKTVSLNGQAPDEK
jgi:hypothetical protein